MHCHGAVPCHEPSARLQPSAGTPTSPAAAVRPSQWPSASPASAPWRRTAALTPAGPPYPNAIPGGVSQPNGAVSPTGLPTTPPTGQSNGPGLGPNPILQPGYKFQGQEVLARVGTEIVQASELLPSVEDILTQNADKIPAEEVDKMRLLLLRQRLTQLINTKLVVATAKHEIPAAICRRSNRKSTSTSRRRSSKK